jgi:hypothetical protein
LGDGPAGLFLAADILCLDERLKKIYGDQAYNGVFADKIEEFGIDFEKASKPESAKCSSLATNILSFQSS